MYPFYTASDSVLVSFTSAHTPSFRFVSSFVFRTSSSSFWSVGFISFSLCLDSVYTRFGCASLLDSSSRQSEGGKGERDDASSQVENELDEIEA